MCLHQHQHAAAAAAGRQGLDREGYLRRRRAAFSADQKRVRAHWQPAGAPWTPDSTTAWLGRRAESRRRALTTPQTQSASGSRWRRAPACRWLCLNLSRCSALPAREAARRSGDPYQVLRAPSPTTAHLTSHALISPDGAACPESSQPTATMCERALTTQGRRCTGWHADATTAASDHISRPASCRPTRPKTGGARLWRAPAAAG
jgi:hypothetical protein